jgi:chorismate mutase/prephenate dehydratase
MGSNLNKLREKIDRLDEKIIHLIRDRMEVVKEIAEVKKEKGIAIIDPEREKELYQNLRSKARGLDLNESDTEIVFREIVSMSRRIQGEERSVAFLGPRGTFTEEASRRIFPESGIEYVACSSIFETFRTVSSGGAFYGVVPVENSTEGPVNTTLDLLVDSDLMVWAEIDLPISHNLIVKPGTNSNDLKIILSHPQALAQCRRYLEEHFRGIELRETSSTGTAVEMLKEMEDAAAIGTSLAAEIYGMKIAFKAIQDNSQNFTRFFVLSKNDREVTGRDKTSILFSVKHVPGALYSALKIFAERDINLTKIESRPTKKKQWEYVFFIDFEGHKSSKAVSKALEKLKDETLFLKIIGSYPRWSG